MTAALLAEVKALRADLAEVKRLLAAGSRAALMREYLPTRAALEYLGWRNRSRLYHWAGRGFLTRDARGWKREEFDAVKLMARAQ